MSRTKAVIIATNAALAVVIVSLKIAHLVYILINSEAVVGQYNLHKASCIKNCTGISPEGDRSVGNNILFRIAPFIFFKLEGENCRHLAWGNKWGGDECIGVLTKGKFSNCLIGCGVNVLQFSNLVEYLHSFICYNAYIAVYAFLAFHIPYKLVRRYWTGQWEATDFRYWLLSWVCLVILSLW